MSEMTSKADGIRITELCRKARRGLLSVEERLELFDANMRWVDELQAEQLLEARANGALVAREDRGWTREDLYDE